MSHLQFYRTSLSRDKVASVTLCVAQHFDSHATHFPNRTVHYSMQLCRAIKLRDKIAGVTAVLKDHGGDKENWCGRSVQLKTNRRRRQSKKM